MKSKITLLSFLFLISGIVYSQNQLPVVKHLIDVQLAACLDSTENQTTYDMMMCCAVARDAWDAEMNKYYKLLILILSDDEKNKLKLAQQAWLDYRDKEYSFSTTVHYNLLGTMYKVAAADRTMEIVKQRAEELRIYYDTIKGAKE